MSGSDDTDEVSQAEFEAATAEGKALMAGPRAARVRFDVFRHRIVVTLTTGFELGFDPRNAQGLVHATLTELSNVRVDALGLAIRFPSLDADFYVPGLLAGRLGSERWMNALAERVANNAGHTTSPASDRSRRLRDRLALLDRRRGLRFG